jgi:hypothetical protein
MGVAIRKASPGASTLRNVMKRGLAGDNLWVVEATSTGRPE